MFKTQMKYRFNPFTILVLIIICIQPIKSQHAEIRDIGVIPGELGKYQGKFDWLNTSSDSITVSLKSYDTRLTIINNNMKVGPNQAAEFAYEIDLSSLIGKVFLKVDVVNDQFVIQENHITAQIVTPVINIFTAYRNVFFPFRTKEQLLNFQNGFRQDTLNAEIFLFNFGGKEIDLSSIEQIEGLRLSFYPDVIPHNGFTKLTAELISDSLFDLGYSKRVIEIKSTKDSVSFFLPIQYTLEKKPSIYQVESPILNISVIEHDFKVINQNETKSFEVMISNGGLAQLEIEKIESNCSCLTYELNQSSIGAGEAVVLKVQFNAKDRSGFEKKTLAIFSNDPRKPTTVVSFKAQIKQ